jgi:hypothetical protein
MNGRERILAQLNGGTADRLPAMPITMQYAANYMGASYRDYAFDHRVLVEAQIRTAERFNIDHVSCISDPAREAADCGAAIEVFEDQPPAFIEENALLAEKKTLAALRLPDPLAGERMLDRVRAVALFKERVGNEKLIEGWVEGPCAQGADLRGINNLMLDFYDDPEFVRDLFQLILEMETRFAKAQIDAGADLIGIGDAAASLAGPQIYSQLIQPVEDSTFDCVPREGYGVVIDLGTPTIVAQLIDLKTGRVKGVRSGFNAQGRHGADIMSRIEFGLSLEGREKLTSLVRTQVGVMVEDLIRSVSVSRIGGDRDDPTARECFEIPEVVLVGNSVMHHLFCGLPVESLSEYPFVLLDGGIKCFEVAELGWGFSGEMMSGPRVRFLPCIAGFVGSDLVAGILATGLCQMEHPCALVDPGTNGEMVVGNRERIVCASTAAGPAFEGARISMGMQAVTGAISRVSVANGELSCHVLGGAEARGLCGSGLVDAVAVGSGLDSIQRPHDGCCGSAPGIGIPASMRRPGTAIGEGRNRCRTPNPGAGVGHPCGGA